jgi:hypothetical protein
LDELGDQPRHVARFGDRFDAQGVLAGSKDAARCIGYLTRQVGDCHHSGTDAQQAHAARLAEALQYQPCSPTCARIRIRRSESIGCPALSPVSGVVLPVREKVARDLCSFAGVHSHA